ncbi:uncharacterized protein N7473_005306 [Penicillium subrubescens]|uniref:uncharacterized protein n=1 Tax=Penicillium subrubescens TaxID=1316194 RepID=UPI00254598CC|nr:uncharacterized protein N7473_005306 [Penicillium subrubescens]KAJ5895907.1 hypothetical protein N7473_005306 [Penicillium subrubescens]
MSTRRQETRSRWGCMTCRSRRKKCSEGQPSCQLCTERGIECIYPDWTAVKFSQTRQRRRQLQDANIGRAVARPTLLPAQPSNHETRFIFHFNTILASLISFSFPQAGTPNPFLQHVLPRTASSVQVQYAVEAVAAAHLYHLGAESGDRATQLHSKALNLLAVELSRPQLDETSRMNLLASSLLLIYYEIVLGNSASNAWCHLQGAKVLLECHRTTPEPPFFSFFRKIFQYFNVMLALSLERRPLQINGDPGPDFTDHMDTVFGCTATLWPLMHRLADLIGRACLGGDISNESKILMDRLHSWSIESSPSTDAYTEAMVQIARSYKYCGLLMLRQAGASEAPEYSTLQDEQIYRSAFDSVLRVCVLSLPMATLTWPLYVVGKLASSTSDRTVILHIFSQFLEKHHMMVVDGARAAVQAHWQEPQPGWQQSAPVLLG